MFINTPKGKIISKNANKFDSEIKNKNSHQQEKNNVLLEY